MTVFGEFCFVLLRRIADRSQRTVAGVGSAGIFSGALVILANIAPLEKRPVYQAGLGSMYGIASVVGPLVCESCLDLVQETD